MILAPRVPRAVWSQEGDVGVSRKIGVYIGGARHVDRWGEVEVSGVPHRQGNGAVGDISPVREHPIVPLAGVTAHPTCIVAYGVE